jgi:hypothetical protein
MLISINQPAYIPWLGYYERIDSSDLHVILDHVQFEKNSFTNRNKILTQNGPIWLTVPVVTKGNFGNLAINKLKFSDISTWKKKHLRSVAQNYSKAPYFKKYYPEFEAILLEEHQFLNDLLFSLDKLFLHFLQITTTICRSSDLNLTSSKSDLVYDICQHFKTETYLSGALGESYLDISKFESSNINVKFQNYIHPSYSQKINEFIPNMSILDLIFNEGENSINIIRKGKNYLM